MSVLVTCLGSFYQQSILILLHLCLGNDYRLNLSSYQDSPLLTTSPILPIWLLANINAKSLHSTRPLSHSNLHVFIYFRKLLLCQGEECLLVLEDRIMGWVIRRKVGEESTYDLFEIGVRLRGDWSKYSAIELDMSLLTRFGREEKRLRICL